MTVELFRIDDRLIHGQVAAKWVVSYDIEQIIIVDDEVANDDIRCNVVRMAAPANLKVNIFSVQQFIDILKQVEIKRRTLILMTTPTTALRLLESGMDIAELNIGGMAYKKNKKQLTKSLSVSNEELISFKNIISKGVATTIQMVPNEEKINLADMIL